jgi:NADH-quinone oxidoreductase subunit A
MLLRRVTGCANHAALQHDQPRGRGACSRPWVKAGASTVADTGTDVMTELLGAYVPIAIFIGLALVIGLALLIAPFAIAYKNPDPEKLSAYECGFNAFDDARMKFDVRFYLVSILFIIFDLEVAFLFPWAVSFGDIGWMGFWSMMVFLGVLTIGFVYEWKKGALEWE